MDAATANRLIDLNRQFYQTFGKDFSATRRRLQPGVLRILGSLEGPERILDLGCGNGELARELVRRGHRGSYLGVDFSLPLLQAAEVGLEGFSARFIQGDLTSTVWDSDLSESSYDIVYLFAVLHHIPGESIRLRLLNKIQRLLKPGGRLILSNWQFLNSDRLKARLQGWELAGLSPAQVDNDDYLLDWRAGGTGLRYAHHFSKNELGALADWTQFRIIETFFSDGQNHKSGLYQSWERDFDA